ncbi:zeta toxin family protein [Streptacidiphilus sp. N1-3]|uniref:UDP-N-acetylglucosamine kinase n=1 Tax=Streptacidiphilus alkalitolerans TaxID=3342712 RepID=A0ABV6XCY3_9ACTN
MIPSIAGPGGLSAEQGERIVAEQILPAVLVGAVPQERPVAVWVCGQPGSGKTTLARQVHAALGRRGGAVLVASDQLKRHHPLYGPLLQADDLTAGQQVRAAVRSWQDRIEEQVRRRGLDAVVETALADPDQARGAAAAYRAAGYRLELVVLAVAESVSQLAVTGRYLRQAAASGGSGRFVSWDNHDACAAQLPATVQLLQDQLRVDQVTVVDRGFTVLYSDELTARGVWRRPPGAAAAVRSERSRPWTAPESARFRAEQAAVEQLRAHQGVRELPARVAGTGIERAAALAEPVRRTAQVRPGTPGVDFHRLSQEEHDWTFEELIWFSFEPLVRAQVNPVAVYVMGQPGAGKTAVATMVKRSLAGRGALRVEADYLKVFHPDFADLLRQDPRSAGAKVRYDVKRWQASFEARLRAARSDVVIEIAPGSTAQLLDSARAFHRAGHRTELVVMAVRAADSRLGTAQRCAEVLRWGLPGRFTSRAGHDVCLRAVADATAAAELGDVFDQVMVTDRDGRPLYRSRRDRSGALDRPPAAARVLAAERARPYTEQEAAAFLHAWRRTWLALPQYRADLVQAAELAGPLLPPRLRPALPATTGVKGGNGALVPVRDLGGRLLGGGQFPVQGLVAGDQFADLGAGQLIQAHAVRCGGA